MRATVMAETFLEAGSLRREIRPSGSVIQMWRVDSKESRL